MLVSCSNCKHCLSKGSYYGLCALKGSKGNGVVELDTMCENFSPAVKCQPEGQRRFGIAKTAAIWFSIGLLAASAINIAWGIMGTAMTGEAFTLLDMRLDIIAALSVIAAGFGCVWYLYNE